MQTIAESSTDEMVAVFLAGELDSPRYGQMIRHCMTIFGVSWREVAKPNFADPAENERRSLLLSGYRGWRRSSELFDAYPCDLVEWRRAVLSAEDLERVFYARHEDWMEVSGGTLSPVVAAQRISGGHVPEGFSLDNITAIGSRLQAGETLPTIIGTGTPSGSVIVVLEGSSRLTAQILNGFPERLEILYGATGLHGLLDWRWFPHGRVAPRDYPGRRVPASGDRVDHS
jgi:hypothetical protein